VRLHLQEMSPSAERMFGCHLADVRGQHLSQILPPSPALSACVSPTWPSSARPSRCGRT
jgi:hypothetical protein